MVGSRSAWRAVSALAVVAAFGVSACGGGSDDASAWPDVPIVATADGSETSSLAAVGDGTTVVSLWATWCGPCKKELPMLEELSAADVDVVGMNIGDSPDAVDAFLTDYAITFDNYIDTDGALMTDLDIPSVPATLIVSDGEIVWRNLGEVTRADIDAQLAALASG